MALTGLETIQLQGVSPTGGPAATTETVTVGAIGAFTSSSVPVTLTNTAGFTLTAAQLSGGLDIVVLLTGTLSAGANIQLPLAATLAALFPALVGGAQGYNLKIVNASSANFAWTVTTNTGWTLNGTMSAAQNTTRSFIVTFPTATTAALTTTGTGTYS